MATITLARPFYYKGILYPRGEVEIPGIQEDELPSTANGGSLLSPAEIDVQRRVAKPRKGASG